MQYADVGREYWSILSKEKFNVQSALNLGMQGIIARDYKRYVLESGVMGVPVCMGSIETLLGHFTPQVFGFECMKHMQEKDLSLLVIIASQVESDGTLHKEILIFECAENNVD